MARRQRGELPTPGGEQYAATDQQCAGARLNDGRKCSINFAWGFGVQAQEVTPESARRRLYVPRFAFESRRIWITEPGNSGWRRDQLMQQLQPLRYFRLSLKAHAGYIAARPAKVGHEAGCNWIAAADEHDRYGRGGSHCGARGDILATNHGHLPASQIGRKCWEPIDLILRPAEFDSDVMAVDEPRFLQAVAECRYSVNCVGSSCCLKESDRRLRARRERQRHRAAEQRDERAPLHVWMAPAWQEIIWRAAQRSLAVMCPACWCSPGGLLALMGSANRVLIIRTGSMSR